MKIHEIFGNKKVDTYAWITWTGGSFEVQRDKPKKWQNNRETLSRIFKALCYQIEEMGASAEHASRLVRALWIEESEPVRPKTLPRIIGEDGFLRMYALGLPLQVDMFLRMWKRLGEPFENRTIQLSAIQVGWNPSDFCYHDVDGTPPGLLPKFFQYSRLKRDQKLLELIMEDLKKFSHIEEDKKREFLSLAVLSHGAAYRELEGEILMIPSFVKAGCLIPYLCKQHLIANGVKTVSLFPQEEGGIAIYLCQGTELWPSQPSVLGSIMANFAEHGSATEAYAHSWRRIHKHLREFSCRPIVAGHSMGGALAQQIALYSHSLVERVYAFNPPAPHERDYYFYHQIASSSKAKLHIFANLDDFAFWRIGSKVIGEVTVFLGKRRWKYYPVNIWDCIFLLPACVKFFMNVYHAFPAHQSIAALYENWVSVQLTQEEIDKENIERTTRFDYLSFLPKLYDPTKNLLTYIRRIFRWSLEKEYLQNEIELISLHERDLLDTINEANTAEILHELKILQGQKSALISHLIGKRKV